MDEKRREREPSPEEIVEANEQISRGQREDESRHGKVIAGQRAEFAAEAGGGKGRRASETEEALERATRNDAQKK